MVKFFRSLKYKILDLADKADQRVSRYGARYILFGTFSLVNYTIPFYMWSYDHGADSLILFIRVTAATINFALIFYESWSYSCKKFLPLFWYFAVTFTLPFFATYMVLIEGFSEYWVINVFLALTLTLIVVDFSCAMIIFPTGMVLGFLAAWLSGIDIDIHIKNNISYQTIYLLLFFGSVAFMFSKNRERIEQEKMNTMQMFGSSIAHEMRTPLATISILCRVIDRELESKKISRKKLIDNIGCIKHEIRELFMIIDMVLAKTNELPGKSRKEMEGVEEVDMIQCVQNAIDRYAFDGTDRNLVTLHKENDFTFKGKSELMVHVIFNLLNNAIYQIKSIGKGDITIRAYRYRNCNVLSFKDTASGVNPSFLKKMFAPLESKKSIGMGLGLYFCKSSVESMGGSIWCSSILGEFTEFFIAFPIDPEKDLMAL